MAEVAEIGMEVEMVEDEEVLVIVVIVAMMIGAEVEAGDGLVEGGDVDGTILWCLTKHRQITIFYEGLIAS